jgi:hypothetical protein
MKSGIYKNLSTLCQVLSTVIHSNKLIREKQKISDNVTASSKGKPNVSLTYDFMRYCDRYIIRRSGPLIQRYVEADTIIMTPHCVCCLSARYYLIFRLHYATDLNTEELWFDSLLRKVKTVATSHATFNLRIKGALFQRIRLPEREAYLVKIFRMSRATHPFPRASS